MIPSPGLEAVATSAEGPLPPSFLVLRNRPLARGAQSAYAEFGPRLRFLDFDALKSYASEAFAVTERRDTYRALVIVRDMIERLIEAVAAEDFSRYRMAAGSRCSNVSQCAPTRPIRASPP
jgi:hypothetical protein